MSFLHENGQSTAPSYIIYACGALLLGLVFGYVGLAVLNTVDGSKYQIAQQTSKPQPRRSKLESYKAPAGAITGFELPAESKLGQAFAKPVILLTTPATDSSKQSEDQIFTQTVQRYTALFDHLKPQLQTWQTDLQNLDSYLNGLSTSVGAIKTDGSGPRSNSNVTAYQQEITAERGKIQNMLSVIGTKLTEINNLTPELQAITGTNVDLSTKTINQVIISLQGVAGEAFRHQILDVQDNFPKAVQASEALLNEAGNNFSLKGTQRVGTSTLEAVEAKIHLLKHEDPIFPQFPTDSRVALQALQAVLQKQQTDDRNAQQAALQAALQKQKTDDAKALQAAVQKQKTDDASALQAAVEKQRTDDATAQKAALQKQKTDDASVKKAALHATMRADKQKRLAAVQRQEDSDKSAQQAAIHKQKTDDASALQAAQAADASKLQAAQAALQKQQTDDQNAQKAAFQHQKDDDAKALQAAVQKQRTDDATAQKVALQKQRTDDQSAQKAILQAVNQTADQTLEATKRDDASKLQAAQAALQKQQTDDQNAQQAAVQAAQAAGKQKLRAAKIALQAAKRADGRALQASQAADAKALQDQKYSSASALQDQKDKDARALQTANQTADQTLQAAKRADKQKLRAGKAAFQHQKDDDAKALQAAVQKQRTDDATAQKATEQRFEQRLGKQRQMIRALQQKARKDASNAQDRAASDTTKLQHEQSQLRAQAQQIQHLRMMNAAHKKYIKDHWFFGGFFTGIPKTIAHGYDWVTKLIAQGYHRSIHALVEANQWTRNLIQQGYAQSANVIGQAYQQTATTIEQAYQQTAATIGQAYHQTIDRIAHVIRWTNKRIATTFEPIRSWLDL